MNNTKNPIPVLTASRSCFSIEWYATEDDAITVGAEAAARGEHYNGGYFHGMRCGRDNSFDLAKDGQALFAVTRG